MTNATQRATWNGELGQFWAEHAERYDQMLAPIGRHVLDAAEIAPGDSVLDLGCGCGLSTRLAAGRCTPGTAVGVDIALPMIEQARRRSEGVANVTFEQADVQTHAFAPHRFDIVISQFGVMFFDDATAAFANVAEALRPGGRLVFSCWRDRERIEQRMVPLRAVAQWVEPPAAREPGRPGAFSLADPDRVRAVLATAGFSGIELFEVTEQLPVGADIEDAARFMVEDQLDSPPPEIAEPAIRAMRTAFEPYATDRGVFLGSSAWVVTAHV